MGIDSLKSLIGFILPPIIDLVNTKVANEKARFWIAMAICFGVGIVLHLNELADMQKILGTMAIIFTESQVIYKTYWSGSVVRDIFYGKAIKNRDA